MRVLRKAVSDEPTKNIAANLLRAGHRIVVSNDSDPFAPSNADAFEQIYNFARERGVLFGFQTRGGPNAVKVIEEHPPTWVYLSFTGDDADEVRLRELGSPHPESRWELAAAAKAAGHAVCIGLNPFRPAWWKDQERLVRRLADMGLDHVWTGDLHISRHQRPNISPKQRERHADEIAYGMLKNKPDRNEANDFGLMLRDAGINEFRGKSSTLGDFWREYEELPGVEATMPTLDSLFVRLKAERDAAGGAKPVVFSFDWFDAWADALPGLWTSPFKEYLQPFGRSIRNLGEQQKAYTFREVHEVYWRVADFHTVFAHTRFGLAVDGDGPDAPVLTDADGRPLMAWTEEESETAVRAVDGEGEDGAAWLLDPDEDEDPNPNELS